MSKIRLAGLTALLCLATPAFAQTQGEAHPHHFDRAALHKEMCVERYAHKVGRLAYLEARLALSDQQKAGFGKWHDAVLEGIGKERAACLETSIPKDGRPTILDREARAETFLALKLETLKATRPALEALYASLNPEQRKVLDHMGHHRHGQFGDHGHHGHHGHFGHMGPMDHHGDAAKSPDGAPQH